MNDPPEPGTNQPAEDSSSQPSALRQLINDSPRFVWVPNDAKQTCELFVKRVRAANPELTDEQALAAILDGEARHHYSLFATTYADDPNRQLVYRRRRLALLNELNLLAPAERNELAHLAIAFQGTTAAIARETGEPLSSIEADVDSMLTCDVAANLAEARDILVNGPIVEDFEESVDGALPNGTIRELLVDTFTIQALRQVKVGRIGKDDLFLIFRNTSINSQLDEANELLRRKVVEYHHGLLLAPDYENYLQAEQYLEKVDDPSELRHLYKVRTAIERREGYKVIQLHSFRTEQMNEYDYLTDLPLSEPDKRRALILGTIVHEIGHGYDRALSSSSQYRAIVQSEQTDTRPIGVSNYVLQHRDLFGTNDEGVAREDFAEVIRLYTTNAQFLAERYPQRFAFIRKNLPFLKADTIVDTLRQLPAVTPQE